MREGAIRMGYLVFPDNNYLWNERAYYEENNHIWAQNGWASAVYLP